MYSLMYVLVTVSVAIWCTHDFIPSYHVISTVYGHDPTAQLVVVMEVEVCDRSVNVQVAGGTMTGPSEHVNT